MCKCYADPSSSPAGPRRSGVTMTTPPEDQVTIEPLLAQDENRDRADRLLIASAIRTAAPTVSKVYVCQLQRFGFSGARLYQVMCEHRMGRPFVVKINKYNKLYEEFANTEAVRALFRIDNLAFVPIARAPTEQEGDAALCYPIISNRSQSVHVSELGDWLFDADHHTASDVIQSLYNSAFEFAHASVRPEAAEWRDVLGNYLRTTQTDRCLDQVFVGQDQIDFAGETIRDPRNWYQALDDIVTLHWSGIHGDLHGQNVVLDGGYNPHLIDFAFANRRGPTLVDYTLLEATIRLMRFPRNVNPQRQLIFQRLLNSELGYLEVQAEIDSWDDPMAFYFRRAATLIGEIRTAAERACGDSWRYEEYQLVLFSTCYGLVAYDSYPLLVTIYVVDSLGRALVEAGGRRGGGSM